MVATVVCMLCVMMIVSSRLWTDAERSVSLRRGEDGLDALWRHWYARIYIFRPRCLAGELSR